MSARPNPVESPLTPSAPATATPDAVRFSLFRWIAGTVIGFAGGLFVASMIRALGSVPPRDSTSPVILQPTDVLPILAGLTCLAHLQAWGFRGPVNRWAWTGASAIGWLAGIALIGLTAIWPIPSRELLALLTGLTIGFVVGVPQALVLRAHSARPWLWIPANAVIFGALSVYVITRSATGGGLANPAASVGLFASYLVIYAVFSAGVMRRLLA